MTAEERFITKVKVTPNCWEWTGTKWGKYGRFSLSHREFMGAHQFSYKTFVGPLEPGKMVCHKCDNPGCVNPKHLFLGTAKDNAVDRHKKGRTTMIFKVGEGHKLHKFTEKDVRDIISKYKTGDYTHAQLAKTYGVHQSAISRVISGKRWPHITRR